MRCKSFFKYARPILMMAILLIVRWQTFPKEPDVSPSNHSLWRCAQRNFTDDEVQFIIVHGNKLHNAGVIFCQLREKDFPYDLPGNHPYRRLIGATVVLSNSGTAIKTLYKNPRAFKRDKKKAKYDLTRSDAAYTA